MLAELSKAVNEFVEKWNSTEGIVIKMGSNFYSQFVEAYESHSNIEVSGIKKFMGIPVEQTHYLLPNQCLIFNEKEIFNDIKNHNIVAGEFIC